MEPVLEFMDYFFPDTGKMIFNSDDKIKVGFNSVTMNGKVLAHFSVLQIGNVKVDPNKLFKEGDIAKAGFNGSEVFRNSILLKGTFLLDKEIEGGGFPKAIIKKIFQDNPSIDSLLVYGYEWRNEPYIWAKLGGKTLITDQASDLHFIQIKKSPTRTGILNRNKEEQVKTFEQFTQQPDTDIIS